MVKYTPQTEWIERRGILMWLAEVSGGFGAGLYLVSLYLNSLWGMFVGWLIILILKGGFHIAFLGKPLRFWRILLKPQTSWIARGLIFVVLFIGFGAMQLAVSYWLQGLIWEIVFKVLAGIMAFGVIIYTGFVMNYVNGIPLWNTALLPMLFVISGALDGFGLVLVIALGDGSIDIMVAEAGSRVLLIVSALLITLYLWSATYMGSTGRYSVIELIRGNIAPVFWVGVVLCGIVIPIVVAFSSYLAGEVSAPLLIMGVVCDTIGAFSLKYCILKAGIYSPLIPTTTH
jgi:formate-dependent nitrite reductase membrane component NrfD